MRFITSNAGCPWEALACELVKLQSTETFAPYFAASHSNPLEQKYGGEVHPSTNILIGELGSCFATKPIM